MREWETALKTKNFAKLEKIMHRETSAGYQVYDLSKIPVACAKTSLCHKKLVSLKYTKGLFENKTIADLGCSLGFFSFYCASQGAKQVTGYDNKELYIELNSLTYEYYSQWNSCSPMQFTQQDLSLLPEISADVVLCNSIIHWLIIKKVELKQIMAWLGNISKVCVLFEGTVSAQEDIMQKHKIKDDQISLNKILKEGENYFSEIEVIGKTTYNPERYVIRFWK